MRKLLKFYLEDVSILGFPCPTLYASSLAWFDKMREAEKTLHKRIRKSTNIETRRLPYFVALAIKFAAQESSLVTLNNRLPAATKTPSSVRGGAKGDEKVPLLSLKDIHVSFSVAWRLTAGSRIAVKARSFRIHWFAGLPRHIMEAILKGSLCQTLFPRSLPLSCPPMRRADTRNR